MKKTTLLLTLVLILSLVFTSCQMIESAISSIEDMTGIKINLGKTPEPRSAAELFQVMNETMDGLESFQDTMSASFDLVVLEIPITSSSTGTSIHINTPGEEYFYNCVTTETSTTSPKTQSETNTEMTVYDDGRLYVANTHNDFDSKLCSDISFEDFLEYYSGSETDNLLAETFNSATNTHFEKKEDGSWTLEFSKVSESVVSSFADEVGFDEDLFGVELKDISIKFEIDEEFRATKISTHFYSDPDADPLIETVSEYSNFNCATKIEFNKEEYTEVFDARIPKMVTDYIGEFIRSDVGDAIVRVTTDYSNSVEEIHFENTDGKFSFTIDSAVDNVKTSTVYADGELKVTSDGQVATGEMSETEAKAAISEVFTQFCFDEYKVSDVQLLSNATYRIGSNAVSPSKFGFSTKTFMSCYPVYAVKIVDGEVENLKISISLSTHPHLGSGRYVVDVYIYFNPEQ